MLYFSLLIATCISALLLSKLGASIFIYKKELPDTSAEEIVHLLTGGAFYQASCQLRALEKHEPDHPQLPILRIRLARQTGNWEHALALAEAYTPSDPQWLAILKEKGKVLLKAGYPQQALAAFEACNILLRDAEDWHALASAHYGVGAYEHALAVLTPHLRTTDSGPLLALAADCRFAQESYAEALSLYKRAEQKGLPSQSLMERMGHCYRKLNQPTETETCFRAVFQTNGAELSAALNLGICLEQQGKHLDALGIYQSESIWLQCDPRVMRRAGISAVHTERYRFAESYLKAAHENGQATADSLAYLGYSIERLRRWAEAEEIYRQLTKEHPEHAAGFRGLAWLYGVGLSSVIKAQEGLEVARRLLALSTEETSWELLSACEARAGNFDHAHQIHESLTQRRQDQSTLQRRRKAMRALRQHVPLDENLVARGLVA